MTATQYTLLAYAVGLVALWGYAALLWLENRRLARRERAQRFFGENR